MRLLIRFVAAFFFAGASALAAAAATNPPAAAAEASTSRLMTLPFTDFGITGSAPLRGVKSEINLPFGTRLDEVAVKATLHLQYSYSPSLLADLSHLKIVLNDQVVETIPLPRDGAGSEQTRDVALDPRYFTDYNHLRIELIAHYTLECEDALHSSLWATISDHSRLEIRLKPLSIAPDLSLLPEPFFDPRDGRALILPLLLPPKADTATLEAAGIMSSWFGALAAYRGATFPVSDGALPERAALVFAANGAQPAGLSLPKVEGPTLSIVANPQHKEVLYLVLQGRDGADLRTAAQALALGQAVLSGKVARVDSVTLGALRPPYDAPNWLPSERPVKFSELVETPTQLQVDGHQPGAIRVNLRLAPDLLTWNRAGVPIDLKYRYTPPASPDNSTLTFTINEQLVRAFRLKADGQTRDRLQLVVPLLGDTFGPSRDQFVIPAFQIGADNQMQFRFVLDYHKPALCTDSAADSVRAAIDPDSTIDLSSFPHYVRMPDLALFANASWPFSKFADLSETAIVLPDAPTMNELSAAYDLLGRIGRHTGAPATRVRFVGESGVDEVKDRNLLIVGGGRADGLLARWAKSLDLHVSTDQRSLGQLAVARALPTELLYGGHRPGFDGEVDFRTDGPLAGLLGFQSPLRAGRSVIALLASSDEARGKLAAALRSPAIVSQLRGDTAIIRGDEVASFTSQRSYFIGRLPWLTQIWLWLARHPWLIVLMGIAAGLLLALWLYSRLRNAAIRRLDT